jgi:accessory gene regulator protein AgrB
MRRRAIDITVYVASLVAWAVLAFCEHYRIIATNNFTLLATALGVFVTIFAFARRKAG